MQSRPFQRLVEWLATGLTVVLFVLWVLMAFARPRHEVPQRHHDAVTATCADIAVLPFRHERDVVLCSGLGSARYDPARFGVLSLMLVGTLTVSIRCSRTRKRRAAQGTA